MAKEVVLNAARRDVTGKQVKELRRQGKLPAVVYGHGVSPIAITLDEHETTLALAGLSASTIVTIQLDGAQHAALVREKQRDYVKNRLIHIDFQVVSLTEKIRAAVRVDLHGESPAVKEFNAVIVQQVNQVEVEALPRDLPERFVVDIAKLAEIGDSITVGDLEVSNKVTVLVPAEEIIVVATGAAPEEVEEEPVESAAEPELIERGKKEDEEEE
jgi:large subunit ribosomal protein L25